MLDRYAKQIPEYIQDMASDKELVWLMGIWSYSFFLSMNDMSHEDYPIFLERESFYKRVCELETKLKHQIVAVVYAVKEAVQKHINVRPKYPVHFGMTSEDLIHNARIIQMERLFKQIYHKHHRISAHSLFNVQTSVMGLTHGQPATPVNLKMYIEAKFGNGFEPKILGRIFGSNGQSTFIKNFIEKPYKDIFYDARYIIRQFCEETIIEVDDKPCLQIGPDNYQLLSWFKYQSIKINSLAKELWDHCRRGILVLKRDPDQAGSSAMPHKVNPILIERVEGLSNIAHAVIEEAIHSNLDTRNLRDLSNSTINRHLLESLVLLNYSFDLLLKALNECSYDIKSIEDEKRKHPECLAEYVRYYEWKMSGDDNYWQIKENPPKNYDDTIKTLQAVFPGVN